MSAATPKSRTSGGDWAPNWRDLGARVASALILIPFGLAVAWYGGPWLAGAAGAIAVAMAYEWARMSEPNATNTAFGFALAGALGAVMLASLHLIAPAMGWLLVCAVASGFRRKSLVAWIETVAGALYVGAPSALFVWLRGRAEEGFATVIALFVIIWATDIFAYFGGRLIGGPRIAEGISPNKTWAGIGAGTLAAAVTGALIGTLVAGSRELMWAWLATGLVIGFTGLMGDLIESFLKRRFGVKDASGLIPGHGGVLDRLDGLMAATLLAGAVLAAFPGLSAHLARGWP